MKRLLALLATFIVSPALLHPITASATSTAEIRYTVESSPSLSDITVSIWRPWANSPEVLQRKTPFAWFYDIEQGSTLTITARGSSYMTCNMSVAIGASASTSSSGSGSVTCRLTAPKGSSYGSY